jgi:ABC-type antimicrobial peptide transport system permease subunit
MHGFSDAVNGLSLIFDIVIMLFVLISILLIYSLLMISVESKAHEIGVMRMVGLNKGGIMLMVIVQALLFVVPSIFLGVMLSFPFLDIIYYFLFPPSTGIRTDLYPHMKAYIQALVLGFIIPIMSSIIPIQKVITQNLNDTLNYNRSNT